MQERNSDFDKVIERRGTDSLKYDCAARRGYPQDVLPLWVADMDFATSSAVTDAVIRRTEHGVFGYTEPGESYFNAVADWMRNMHGWNVNSSWLVKTPGVVFALAAAVKAFTKEGDSVLIQQPVYYPFSEVIEDNGRRVVSSDLVKDDDGNYTIDFEDFERKVKENNVRLFLLCNPHNPVGRVWTEEELAKIGGICLNYGVVVVSDEIHEDFVFCGKHCVFADISNSLRDITVTCTSPAKTFNLAGLQVSNIFIADKTLRQAFKRAVAATGYSQLNTLGLTACEAAYRSGGTWYKMVKAYIWGNIRFTAEFLQKNMPKVKLTPPQGTYLLWLDFSAYGLTESERQDIIVNKAGVWLDSGVVFGKAGEGFERINVACPRATLERALNKLKSAFGGI
ncbi:MAG: pyridoxal phosphate-dependent aminotransferase [Clostridia bacterium]|nr:pyridoxal phosphate-dependent aminotransferase [Clostridia bacterium]